MISDPIRRRSAVNALQNIARIAIAAPRLIVIYDGSKSKRGSTESKQADLTRCKVSRGAKSETP